MLAPLARGRTAVFVDASNVFYSQRTLGWRIDYEKLFSYLKSEIKLTSARFYTGFDPVNERQGKFLAKLSGLGYVVHAKELKVIRVGSEQIMHKGSLDIELVIDALKHANAFDTFLLMSGDSDFAPLLDELKERGKNIIVISVRGRVAWELVERSEFVPWSKLRPWVEKSENRPGGRSPNVY
jgi:uncharacterized LabA/DUF88 family protein